MNSDWRKCLLGDVVNLKRGFDLPARERKQGAVPVISSSGTSDFHAEAKVKGPGVVTGRYGTIGNVYYTEQDYWPLNTTLFVEDFKGNDPRFIYFFLQTIDYLRYSDKAAVPGVNRNHLHSAEVILPPIDVQKKIAAFLGSLEDRINLLRETNTTLEAIAQALFKSWFVDFDPVRAKQDGRKPEGIDAGTAALFPNEFDESELGPIPKGWSIARVEEISEKVGMGPFGSNIKTSTFVDIGVPVLNGKNLQQFLLEDSDYNFITEIHAEKLKNSMVSAGDVVFTHRGTLGQVALVPEGSQYKKYMISQSQFFLRCDRAKARPEWIIYFFRSTNGQHLLLANASQVGVPSIARPVSYLRSIKIVLPSMKVMERFADLVVNLHRSAVTNRDRIRTLVTIRDTSLPRLISGHLRLPEAEQQFNEAFTGT